MSKALLSERYPALIAPAKLWSRLEVLVRDCPVPKAPGVYAWYFRDLPGGVPATGCHCHGPLRLLYVGISPKRPPADGSPGSRQTLRSRIRYDFRGNAAGSTLRLSLGCLLAPVIGTEPRRVGSGLRYTFADKEAVLSEWMGHNAFVAWLPIEEPWTHEQALIQHLRLPLNLDQNRDHDFHVTLSACRRAARERAASLPVWTRG